MASTIGSKIKEYRIEKGYTLAELAKKTNIPMQTLSHYETGRQLPPIKKLNNIAEALEVCFYVKFGKRKSEKRINN